MRHTIEFTLPDDADDLDLALFAPEMSAALHDIYEYLRTQAKNAEHTGHPIDIFTVKEAFHHILVANGLGAML